MNEEKVKIYTVTELTQLIKNHLEKKFIDIWLTGEISNYKMYSSGHAYFSLKDENSQINAIIFSNDLQSVKFRVEDGQKVIVYGRISIYAKRGEYRIVVTYIEPIGKGALQIAFEQLKEKLAKEGLFDTSRKKPIPLLPQKIGIVTSRDGAALRDILTVLKRRFANVEILIYPVKVQGEEAKYEIAEAIKYLNDNYKELDVLLVGRGGGSLEDLWPFNEEIVARAIYNSKIPVISCVGHEIDFTIADFVADLRAPTPSAAAEIVIKSKQELKDRISGLYSRLRNCFNYVVNSVFQRMNEIINTNMFRNPQILIEEKTLILDDLSTDLNNSIKHLFEIKFRDFKILSEKINTLSPLSILSRGYSIVWKLPENIIIKDSKKVCINDNLKIKLFKGELESKIIKITE